MRKRKLLACLLAYRLLNALLTQTFFSPDEFYQCIEPAYLRTFHPHLWQDGLRLHRNDGTSSVTWEWRHKIRSGLMVECLTAVYYIIKWLRIDYSLVIRMTPKLLAAILSAVGDYHLIAFLSQFFPQLITFDVVLSCNSQCSIYACSWCWCLQIGSGGSSARGRCQIPLKVR